MNVYAWSEYFPPSVIDKFQKETGLHVNYSVFDSPDAAETALSVGHSNYDIVTMNASPHLAREIPKGFWMKLDPSKIPNAANSDPRILKILGQVDPGNRFAVPWMWGTVGILYNADKARAILGDTPITSLDVVLNKATAAKFAKCGISVLDSWQDIMPLVARYLGQPQLSDDPAKLDAVVAKLSEIKPMLRRIASSPLNTNASFGTVTHGYTYSGHPVAAAAALATLDVLQKNDVLSNVRTQGEHLLARLHAMANRFPIIGDVRGVGLMVCLELVADRKTKAAFGRGAKQVTQVAREAYQRGAMVRTSGPNIILSPALTIEREQIDLLCDALEGAFAATPI